MVPSLARSPAQLLPARAYKANLHRFLIPMSSSANSVRDKGRKENEGSAASPSIGQATSYSSDCATAYPKGHMSYFMLLLSFLVNKHQVAGLR